MIKKEIKQGRGRRDKHLIGLKHLALHNLGRKRLANIRVLWAPKTEVWWAEKPEGVGKVSHRNCKLRKWRTEGNPETEPSYQNGNVFRQLRASKRRPRKADKSQWEVRKTRQLRIKLKNFRVQSWHKPLSKTIKKTNSGSINREMKEFWGKWGLKKTRGWKIFLQLFVRCKSYLPA